MMVVLLQFGRKDDHSVLSELFEMIQVNPHLFTPTVNQFCSPVVLTVTAILRYGCNAAVLLLR